MMRLHGFVQGWFLYAKPPRHTRPQMLIEMGCVLASLIHVLTQGVQGSPYIAAKMSGQGLQLLDLSSD